jgi:hypothetical protein
VPVTGVAAAGVDPVAALVDALNAATTAVTSATSTLAGRQVIAGTGLTGGGTLAADRTFTVDFAASGVSSSTKVTRADDSRLSDTRTPSAGSVATSTLASSLVIDGGTP